MVTDSKKVVGIVLLFIAVLIATINIILVTNFSILDSDPTTYIIVVMLMIFAFIAFSLKEDLHFAYNKKAIIYGIIIFVAYLLILSYLRGAFSYVFSTYRLDALLIPLLLSSFILIIFGFNGLKKLKFLLIYALFASPLLLMPLFALNSGFANANAYFVYDVLKVLGAPVTINGISITSSSLLSISIATTCAPLGTFAALAFFMIPVAYLYEGRSKNKALWVASGVALMLLFNFIRMFIIAIEWLYYGLGQAVGVFHLFAGQILFYIAIIVMLLIAGKYGMKLGRVKKHAFANAKKEFTFKSVRHIALPIVLVIALAILGMLFTLPYLSVIHASAANFYANVNYINQTFAYRVAGGTLGKISSNALTVGATGFGAVFAINNGSNINNTIFVIASVKNTPTVGYMVTNYTGIENEHSYIMKNGITLRSAVLRSGNLTFDINYFSAPYNISNIYISTNYEFFRAVNSSSISSCDLVDYQNAGLFNHIESDIYNTLNGRFSYSNYGFMCDAYLVANEI
jgi:exosortase/archaeosortase family protein